ncbi:MAG: ribonuclease III [Clostridia bacterium]|nr:ribonuclease III [Clostridia bacterium]
MQVGKTDQSGELGGLMGALDYRFADVGLLRLALTHPSFALQREARDNQRLEYLGDAVLQLCVSRRLYDMFPNLPEGQLSRRRALLVCEPSLCEAARRLGLGEALLLDRGETQTGGRTKPSVLADAMEAVIAAVYLDGGIEAAAALVDRAIGDYDRGDVLRVDAKTALQEFLQAQCHPAPVYESAGEEGPPHERLFTERVVLGEGQAFEGQGGSKKQAQQQAAQRALEQLKS